MRILHVIPTYAPAWRHGGPVRAVEGLARAQAVLGHAVTVFTTHRDGRGVLNVPTDRVVVRDGVAVRYFALGFPRRVDRAPQMSRALEELLRSIDIVHLHSVFLWPTWAAARAARRVEKPYVISPRGMLVEELLRRRGALRKRVWIALIERRNLTRAAAVHLTSSLEERELAQLGIRCRATFVLPNGVAIPSFAPRTRRPDGTIELLFLGRISWKKGLDLLIETLALLPEARLVVAGPDDEGLRAGLSRAAERNGVAPRLEWKGAVGDEERDRLFAQSDLLVLPSRSENFGNVVIEAMAAGLPVVVSPEVGAAEIVARARSGEVVPGDPRLLAEAIRRLVARPAEMESMSEAGRRYAEERLAWPRVAAAMVDAYAKAGAREAAA
jgi:glycosyltransferase involved in cell wall biosynthesis